MTALELARADLRNAFAENGAVMIRYRSAAERAAETRVPHPQLELMLHEARRTVEWASTYEAAEENRGLVATLRALAVDAERALLDAVALTTTRGVA